jgi:urease accessory protein
MAGPITPTIMAMDTAMTIEAPSAFRDAMAADCAISAALFAWFSPAFPTGGFAYSHGIEAAAADGRVLDERSLAEWIEAVLANGAGWADAVLLNAAHHLTLMGDTGALTELADLACALTPSRERLAETMGQGEAFVAALRHGWPEAVWPEPLRPLPYPVAAGVASARIGAAARVALAAYLTAFAANLIAAGVRLNLTGQSGGVRILSGLGPVIVELAGRAAGSSLDDLGACALGSDIASMRHETLAGRLFIS